MSGLLEGFLKGFFDLHGKIDIHKMKTIEADISISTVHIP